MLIDAELRLPEQSNPPLTIPSTTNLTRQPSYYLLSLHFGDSLDVRNPPYAIL